MASNMDGVGTFAMARVLQEFKNAYGDQKALYN